MKIAFINTVCYGSTGRLIHDIQKECQIEKYETMTFFGRGIGYDDLPCKKISNTLDFIFHASLATIFGTNGHYSTICTKMFIKELKKFNPDVIHINNVHGFYLNYKLFFHYLKNKYKGRIVWTLHDCWTLTGHCAFFSQINCSKWKNNCKKCPNLKTYPPTFFDRSQEEYKYKKRLFSNINNLTLVVPSDWLFNIVKYSYLKKYDRSVINNYIDFNTFKIKNRNEIINKKYSELQGKKIYLAIANIWTELKGINIINEMAKHLFENEIILVIGKISPKYTIKNSDKIKYINQTNNVQELVELYNISDVLINPSASESFSMVTLEAIACGTPVIVFNNSAVKDLVINDNVGTIIDYSSNKNYNSFLNDARKINNRIEENMIEIYKEKYSDKNNIREYINLFNMKGKNNE